MSLSFTVSLYSETLVENRQFEPTLPVFGALFGVIWLEFRRDFGVRKLESLGYRMALCDPMFSHLCTTPTCDGQTDTHTMTANTVLA